MREPGFKRTVCLHCASKGTPQEPWWGTEGGGTEWSGLLGSLCPFPPEKLDVSLFVRVCSYLRFLLNKGSAAKTERLKTIALNNSGI